MLDYRLNPRLSVGIEHDGESEVVPRATWFALMPTATAPGVTIGVSSDRLSIPRGSAFFATASKAIPDSNVTPFVSLKYATDTQEFAVPFGANVVLSNKDVVQFLYDGANPHLLITRPNPNGSVSFVLGRLRYPGVSVSFGW